MIAKHIKSKPNKIVMYKLKLKESYRDHTLAKKWLKQRFKGESLYRGDTQSSDFVEPPFL